MSACCLCCQFRVHVLYMQMGNDDLWNIFLASRRRYPYPVLHLNIEFPHPPVKAGLSTNRDTIFPLPSPRRVLPTQKSSTSCGANFSKSSTCKNPSLIPPPLTASSRSCFARANASLTKISRYFPTRFIAPFWICVCSFSKFSYRRRARSGAGIDGEADAKEAAGGLAVVGRMGASCMRSSLSMSMSSSNSSCSSPEERMTVGWGWVSARDVGAATFLGAAGPRLAVVVCAVGAFMGRGGLN
ncbi:hypothetical protein IAQ61_005295 [Plenodomus lingam]|uniref:uncharacterized protein n=1 Tax=Leptosphaeria maculans TaxID=5022 RepID=UPI0033217CC7|nr:hypothetical protein IAQ61_005295 [Plenodomus lingam]